MRAGGTRSGPCGGRPGRRPPSAGPCRWRRPLSLVLFEPIEDQVESELELVAVVVAGPEDVLSRLVHPHMIWLPIALGASVASYLGYMLAYRECACAGSGPNLPLKIGRSRQLRQASVTPSCHR